ncbi:hybrid sensor histidine kinase/response regulator [Treponema sp. R8-4-B8]
MGSFFKKLRKLRFQAQVAAIFLAFALMVVTTYFFVSRIEDENLRKMVKESISYTEANIKAAMLEPETILAGIAQTIRGMIMWGNGAEAIQEYILYINSYVQSNVENRLSGVIGFYGIFDANGKKFTAGNAGYFQTENGELENRLWYKAAVEANGEIGITQPYFDGASPRGRITFSRRIFNGNGAALGIVCLEMNFDKIGELAVNTPFSKESLGFMLSENLMIIAHHESSMLGKALHDVNIGIASSIVELEHQGFVSEFKTTNYRGVKSVLFIEKLFNGWYIGVITPEDMYYRSTRNLALILITLGTVLSVLLSIILLRISAERNNVEERLRVLFNATPLSANILKSNYKFIDCNESALNLFELSNKQEYFEKFYLLSPEYQPDGSPSAKKMIENIERTLSEGYYCFTWMHQKLNGEQIPCDITGVRVNFNNEYALAFYLRDLRELKQMMDKIDSREHLLNTVNAAANILLSIKDEKSFSSSLIKSFELLGYCLDVDRVHIWSYELIDDEWCFAVKYEWLSDYGRVCKQIPEGFHVSEKEKPGWKKLFLRGDHINSPLSALPESERDFFSTYRIQAIVAIPMFMENNFWGFFSIDDCRRERLFSNDEIRILTSVALMMSNAINRNLQTNKLREADKRMHAMFDSAPIGTNFWDNNCYLIDCNMELVKMFELTSKDEYCERFYEFSPEYQPDGSLSRKKAYEYVKKAFDEGYCRFEWMHQKLNGEIIPCDITLVRNEYDDKFIVTGYTYDLRELRKIVTQMNASKKSLNIMENILNGIDAVVYVTVPDTGEILFVNDYMKKELNLGSDCIGQMCYKVIQNTDKKCEFCPCYKLDKEPESTIVWEAHYTGTKRIYRCMDRYIEWYDDRTVHIQHAIDMTEMIAAKESAEQSNRYKSQFLSRMSHEVRTPMNAILGITEIQMQNGKLHADTKEALSKISASGYLLLGIINDILDMSKIEAGKLELAHLPYDVASLIGDSMNMNIYKYDYKPIEFSLVVDENIPIQLIGDELRIKQILNNLLSNAYKYTDKGSIAMSVAAEYPQQKGSDQITLVFRIADTGQGMTREQMDKLFDEYTRFNMETNRAVEGTGLGMNITNNLVKLMNGAISVESEVDKGSVFTVRLPQDIADSSLLGKETAENLMQFHHLQTRQSNKTSQLVREYMPYGRVLIVDDMETNLYVARGLMAPYCLSLETATSGFIAIDKIKAGSSFDIIFMDHFMPKMDGIETVKIIRELGYTKPIIALTANALAGMEEMFKANGFDGFISKPIDIRQLNFYLNKFIRDKYPPEVVKAAQKQAAFIKTSSDTKEKQSSDEGLKTVFLRDAKKALERLTMMRDNAYRREDDIKQFIVNTHAMKSTLANIGETALSADAFELEKAGREENMPVILEKTPLFLEELKKVIEKLEPNENDIDEEREDSEYDMEFLGEKLLVVQKAFGEYDEQSANIALKELLQRKWPRSVNEFLTAISEYLLHSDFDEAVNIIGSYIENNIPQSVKG